MIADAVASDTAAQLPLTSNQACQLLLGPRLYRLYTRWQLDIASTDEAKHYDPTAEWTEIRDIVAVQPIGQLPYPKVYLAFMRTHRVELYPQDEDSEAAVEEEQERGDERTTPGFLVAKLCGHAVHPGSPSRVDRACPVCSMRVCIDLLKRIAHVWELLGGPIMEEEKPTDTIEYRIRCATKRLWRTEKVHWAKMVYAGEMCAGLEENWEAEALQAGSSIDDDVKRCKSWTEALEIARECPYILEDGRYVSFVPRSASTQLPHSPPYSPETAKAEQQELPLQFDGALDTLQDDRTSWTLRDDEAVAFTLSDTVACPPSPSTSPPNCPSSPPSSVKSSSSCDSLTSNSNHVTFADDVIDEPSRETKFYWRRGKEYQKGRYAAPPGSKWQDTSFLKDVLYDVTENDETTLERLIKAREEALKEEAGLEISTFKPTPLGWSEKKENEKSLDGLELVTDDSWGADFDPFAVGEDDDFLDVVEEGDDDEFSEKPLFRFQPRKQAPARDVAVQGSHEEKSDVAMRRLSPAATPVSPAAETELTITAADENEDGQKLGEIPLAGQASSRRRSRDEFEEAGEVKQEPEVKRHCQWTSFMMAHGLGF
jgi:hypothetical protein